MHAYLEVRAACEARKVRHLASEEMLRTPLKSYRYIDDELMRILPRHSEGHNPHAMAGMAVMAVHGHAGQAAARP